MPLGGFLDSLPSALFVAAHIIFLVIGIWLIQQAHKKKAPYGSALWLYVLSQLFFLAFFGGLITMKMAVLIEQTLIVIMVLMIVLKKPASA